MGVDARRLLRELEEIRAAYGGGASARKAALLDALRRRSLARAGDVLRLHEVLCFLRAYPDDRPLLRLVETLLEEFERRADLRRFREELADSGIAGTPIRFSFYAPMARWLAARWDDRLHVEWDDFERQAVLRRLLFLIAPYAEYPPAEESPEPTRGWIDRLRGPKETDAAFLVRWFSGASLGEGRDWAWEELEVPLRLEPGPGTPSRTGAHLRAASVRFQAGPLDRSRPDLRSVLAQRPRSVSDAGPARARALIDLALEAMVTRSRDLDVFSEADPRDVRLVDWGDGLQFAVIGTRPGARFLLESVYGFLTLKNNVPIGYVLVTSLFGSAEIAYNVFETYRGAEAGLVYGRVLATARHLFGADAFTVDPYQLGHENDEALHSGAWWFYRKLGFRPLDPAVLRVMRAEERRMARDPRHRSGIPTLAKLASRHVFWQAGRFRRDVLAILPLGNVGLRITDYLAGRFGSDRSAARAVCSREAARRLGVRVPRALSSDERHAWERWAPLLLLLPRLPSWPAGDRRELLRIIRAKGGARESEYQARFDRHARLRAAIRGLARPARRRRGARS